ncbi:MAG: hypothetical protein Q8N05_22955 [Bacteroidota bacterium]|nr:hypothetical protein [Bacteroidota bacterium]
MRKLILILFCMVPLFTYSVEDWMWWNIKHGWETGMPGWRTMIHITPGYLGPNALPVPNVKKGVVTAGANLEFGLDFHFKEGDPTQDIFAKYYRSFADNKIAIELYGVAMEHYAMSDYIRDERIARDFDGKGIAVGDLYFSTLVQLVKDRKFPDTMLRMAGRTASGGHLDAARYSDSPGYFFDLSFSKEYAGRNETMSFMPFASFGFYSWQTNDELNLQNDTYMYGVGADLKGAGWIISNSLSGYSGYKKERDKPMVYSIDLQHKVKNNSIRLQYLHGLRDWTYRTVKLSWIINLKK